MAGNRKLASRILHNFVTDAGILFDPIQFKR